MKKIGIITIHFPYNYGAMLQAYATQVYLEDNGYNSEIIDFRPYEIDKNYHIRAEMIVRDPKLFCLLIACKMLGKRKKYNNFDYFLNKYIKKSKKKYRKISENTSLPYDLVVAGSDQIWNPEIIQNRYEYLLAFNCKEKISYASSVGLSSLSKQEMAKYYGYLKQFRMLSVREESAVKILNEMSFESVSKVCDPVFLLNKKHWINMEKRPDCFIDSKYVLIYSLQDNCDMNSLAKLYASKHNYPIVSIHPLGKKNCIADYCLDDIGPLEFLYLINHAEMVFSNSFHAVCFSIIFNTKICPFLHTVTGTRVKNLISQFSLDAEYEDEIKYYINSNKSQQKIDEIVDYSKEYFKKALEI